jgi:hypothetical protein
MNLPYSCPKIYLFENGTSFSFRLSSRKESVKSLRQAFLRRSVLKRTSINPGLRTYCWLSRVREMWASGIGGLQHGLHTALHYYAVPDYGAHNTSGNYGVPTQGASLQV